MKNIIYLHTHDTGRCISPYGYALDTPHLDTLARQSVLFRNAFDCCPTCSPARASLLTGQYPHQCGMTGLAHRGFALNTPSRHLASFLASQGYETALAGVQHEFAGEVFHLGYQRNFQFSGKLPEIDVARQRMLIDATNCESACRYLRETHSRPFFLSVGLVSTHRCFPVQPDPEDNPDYMLPPPPIPNNPVGRLDWARFATMVRHVDRCFAKIIDEVRNSDLEKNTLIIVTSDHGPAFPGMKCCLTDNGTAIPIILHASDLPAGFVSDALVSHLDLFPTICEWAGLQKPDWLQGTSLMALVNKQVPMVHDAVFAELSFHASLEILRSVRTPRFRYVKRFDDYPKFILPNMDNGDLKRFLVSEAGLAEKPRQPQEQLFDLFYDPCETNSVASLPEYADVLEDMRERLASWMQETGDPLVRGSMPLPKGVMLDPQDAREPTP